MVEFVISVAMAAVEEEDYNENDVQPEGKKGLLLDQFFPTQAEETKIHRNQYINHHTATDNINRTEKCPHCGKLFNINGIGAHIRGCPKNPDGYKTKKPRQTDPTPRKCHVCGKEFADGRGYPAHLEHCERTHRNTTGNTGTEAKNAPITAQSFGEFAAKMDAAKRGNTLTFPEKH